MSTSAPMQPAKTTMTTAIMMQSLTAMQKKGAQDMLKAPPSPWATRRPVNASSKWSGNTDPHRPGHRHIYPLASHLSQSTRRTVNVQLHIPGDPQSVQQGNATTTTPPTNALLVSLFQFSTGLACLTRSLKSVQLGKATSRRRRRIPTIASDVPDAVSQAEEAGDDEERQHGVRVGLPKPHEQEQAHVKGGGCTKQEKKASP